MIVNNLIIIERLEFKGKQTNLQNDDIVTFSYKSGTMSFSRCGTTIEVVPYESDGEAGLGVDCIIIAQRERLSIETVLGITTIISLSINHSRLGLKCLSQDNKKLVFQVKKV